jgi:hypothetical protein
VFVGTNAHVAHGNANLDPLQAGADLERKLQNQSHS